MHNQYPQTSCTPNTPYTSSLNKHSLTRRGALPLPLITILLLASVGFTRAQTPPTTATKTPKVEVKDDRFSGKRTVTLAPIHISADLEMQLSGVIETARKPDYMEQDLGVMITAEFATPADSKVEFTSEMDFIFLVDGKRTMRAAAGDNISTDVMRRDGRRTAIGVLTQSTLERIAAGRKVEIKLSDTEAALDDATLKNIRAFVAALRR